MVFETNCISQFFAEYFQFKSLPLIIARRCSVGYCVRPAPSNRTETATVTGPRPRHGDDDDTLP